MLRKLLSLSAFLLLASCAMQKPGSFEIPWQRSSSNEQEDGLTALLSAVQGSGLLLTSTGSEAAPHEIILVTEAHCVECREFQLQYLPQILEPFLSKGSVHLTVVPLILRKYEGSRSAALVTACAEKLGLGFRIHAILFPVAANRRNDYGGMGNTLGMNQKSLDACLADPATIAAVEAQQQLLSGAHINLVPTFIIDGDVRVGLPSPREFQQELAALSSE